MASFTFKHLADIVGEVDPEESRGIFAISLSNIKEDIAEEVSQHAEWS
jgi:hypothetical protein